MLGQLIPSETLSCGGRGAEHSIVFCLDQELRGTGKWF